MSRLKVFVSWKSVAPEPLSSRVPAGFDGSVPGAYPSAAWAPYDAIVRGAVARGIKLELTLAGPGPTWATASGQPLPGPAGVWKPSPILFRQFVRAVATRYDGHYTPSGYSSPLPRVSFWSIWNEPNYGPDLAPQAINYSTVEVSPRLYRGLLDAAWSALRDAGHGSDTILWGELAPRGLTIGDQPGNYSGMVPLRFLRALYCVNSSFQVLRGEAAAARGCPTGAAASSAFAKTNPALFKATGFAVHPYPEGSLPPDVTAPNEPDYADLASLPVLEGTLDRLQRVYGSSTRFPIYSTEFGYITNPPSRTIRGTPLSLAASYLNWAEYLSWRDPRVRSFDQFLLHDPTVGNFASGLEFANGAPKPSFYAFRLPIFLPSTSTTKGQALEVWGCIRPAPYAKLDTGAAQSVRIQFEGSGRAFRRLKQVVVTDPNGYFDLRMTFPSSGSLRLAWTYPHGQTIYSRTVEVTVR